MHYTIVLHNPSVKVILVPGWITMVGDKETPPQCNCHGCHVPSHAHYQNNIFIPIIERILSNGAEAWHLVVGAHKANSGEHKLHTEEDLNNKWVRKFCINFEKPTGSTRDITDQIHSCIEIKRHIQCQSNSGILGAYQRKKLSDSDLLQDEASGDLSNIATNPKRKLMFNP